MTLASLGSSCVFEHMFDKVFEFSQTYSKWYTNTVKTDYKLVRNTVLNGGTPSITNVIDILKCKNLIIDGIRLSSDKEYICQSKMRFIIHNNYGGKCFSNNDELKIGMLRLFDNYKNIDIFIYYSYNISNIQQLKDLLSACRIYSKNAKLLCFSNLEDCNIDRNIVNINVISEIIYKVNEHLPNYDFFEHAWNVPSIFIDKISKINFNATLFNEFKK